MIPDRIIEQGTLKTHGSRAEVEVRLPWYRALPGSCIGQAGLTIDGVAAPVDSLRWSMNGREFTFADLSSNTDEWWFPLDSAVLSGDEAGPHDIQGIGAGFCPKVLELDRMDAVMRASEREAIAAARRCAQDEGIPIGISSGAVLHAALQVARDPAMKGKLVIGIAASFAERYLSTELFAGL